MNPTSTGITTPAQNIMHRSRSRDSYRSHRTSEKDDRYSRSYDSRDRDRGRRTRGRDGDRQRDNRDNDRERERDRDRDRYRDHSSRDNYKDFSKRDTDSRRSRDKEQISSTRRRSRSPRNDQRTSPDEHKFESRQARQGESTYSNQNSSTISSLIGTNSRSDGADKTRDSERATPQMGNSGSVSSANSASSLASKQSSSILDEEKKRKRMERLELWKQKKAQEKAQAEAASSSNTAKPQPEGASPTTLSTQGSKLTENQTRPEVTNTDSSAKKKVLKPLSSKLPATNPSTVLTNSVPKVSTSMNIRIGLNKSSETAKANLGFEEVPEKKLAKLPSKSIFDTKALETEDTEMKDTESDEEDPLDAFMSQMESTTPAPQISSLPSLVMNDENDGYDGNATESEEENPEDYREKLEQKKRKDIPTVDHSKILYEPFRKQFYYESPELATMSNEDADMLRLELDGIKIRGVNCPKPVLKWPQFGLPVPTMNVINNLGYEKPTSIQAQAIPAIMSGRDVIGVAKTGSGKTMAFLLPLFRQIKDQRPLASHEGPMALVMTPTRELAVQIYRECRPFLKALDLRAVCAYGGSPIKDQIADLKRGAEIVVCTPGRMIDLLAANSGRVINLQRVTYLVLDEADRMFDMGFEPQVMKIIGNIRPDRQTVLFSATFPKQMEVLARKTLKKAVEIIVGARSVVAPEITQIVEVRPDNQKFTRTLELLGEFYNKTPDDRVLIFVDRQESADLLLKDLMTRGYPCLSIHGGKDQIDRDSAISDFKSGVASLLIATSVAARGLDVKQLKLVINYDAPNHMEDYVHRVGRTGRAGNTGTAVTFVTPEQDRAAVDISKALRLSKVEIPQELQKLADEFMEKVKQGKEKVGSGFGGKGLEKLDEARDTARKRERKAYGEDGAENGTDDTKKAAIAEITQLDEDDNKEEESLESKYSIEPTVVKAGQHASRLEASSKRHGVLRAGAAPDNHGPDTGAFHTTLEINDYPQKARWAVTNNANITKVIEANSVSITTKGIFYPTGKIPGEGDEPKLYLLIEGQTETSVANARKGLATLLIEGMEQAAQSESRAPTGRYTIK